MEHVQWLRKNMNLILLAGILVAILTSPGLKRPKRSYQQSSLLHGCELLAISHSSCRKVVYILALKKALLLVMLREVFDLRWLDMLTLLLSRLAETKAANRERLLAI
jgi:hypothetical protein